MANRDIHVEYQRLVEALGPEIPEIGAIVDRMRGIEQLDGTLGMRVMDAEEVLEVRARLANEAWIYPKLLFVLADHGGDYMGPWVQGQLEGRWSWYHHDEIDLSPVYRSTASLLRAVAAKPGAESIYDLTPDYPDVHGTGTPEEQHAERAIIARYRGSLAEQTEDETLACFFAFTIAQLTPRDDLDQLLPLLDHDNMWIQERVAVVLGDHRYQPARAQLEALAASSGNGALAARGALAKLDAA